MFNKHKKAILAQIEQYEKEFGKGETPQERNWRFAEWCRLKGYALRKKWVKGG